MTFTRTASGVANYNKFFCSDIVLFCEGKKGANSNLEVLPDQTFYTALFKSINPKWIVKVKCVGNKAAALGYIDLVRRNKDKKYLIAIDKDSFGISSSYIETPEVIVTHGYSWENDLFAYRLALDILSDITRGNDDAARVFSYLFKTTMRRLKLLSALDMSCQVDGKALLPKSSKTGGIAFKKSKGSLISTNEVSRFIDKYRSMVTDCPIICETRASAYRAKSQQVIQGHIWECAVRQLVSAAANNLAGIAQLPSTLFSNLMLARFSNNPAYYLGDDTYQYYRSHILARLS